MRKLNILGIAGFCLCLSLPLILHILTATHIVNPASIIGQNHENRRLTQAPPLNELAKEPTRYTASWSSFVEDRFGARTLMIRAYKKIETRLNRQTSRVILGTETPWLFLSSLETKAQFNGTPYLDAAEIAQWNTKYTRMKDAYHTQDISFLSIKLPTKARSYAEYVPTSFGAHYVDEPDQDLTFDLSVEAALIAAKAHGQVFKKTDTHWTNFGAEKAYIEIMKALELKPRRAVRYKPVSKTDFSGDLVRLASLDETRYHEAYDDIRHPYPKAIKRETISHADPRFKSYILRRSKAPRKSLVIIGDSFTHAIAPFFLSDFNQVVFLHHQLGALDINAPLDYNPDTILFMPAGRFSYMALGEE